MLCHDYKCNKCEKMFEEYTDSDNLNVKVHCPYCGSFEVTKQFPMPRRVTVQGSNQMFS